MEKYKTYSSAQRMESIFSQFECLAQSFCDENSGLFCKIENRYKGTQKPENVSEKRAKIYFSAFAIEFVYTVHGFMGVINSILSCNVFLEKAEGTRGIPLPLFTDYCGKDVKEPLCIPFITTPQGMIQAFQCIGAVAENMLPALLKICTNQEDLDRVRNCFDSELRSVFRINPALRETERQRQILSNLLVSRFADGAFLAALRGDFSKAARALEKQNSLTGYEKRMIQLWQHCDFAAMVPAINTNARAFSGKGTSKMELREGLAAFVGSILLFPCFTAVYLGVFGLSVWLQGYDSVFLAGPQYNFPYCFLAGFLTAIVASWFVRFFLFKLLFRKDYEQYCEMESIQNLKGLNKLMGGFGILVVVACTAFCLLISGWNMNFARDGFTDNTTFFSVTGEYHPYSEVEYVYYKSDRINGLGETVAVPSYVIVLRDGKEIDLVGYGSVDDISRHLLPFFQEQGIRIQ